MSDRSSERGAAALAYPLGFVSGLVVLWSSRSPFVRFHAWQSILLSGALLLALAGLELVPLLGLGLLLGLGVGTVVVVLILMWRAARGEWTMLPLIGDVALERVRGRSRSREVEEDG